MSGLPSPRRIVTAQEGSVGVVWKDAPAVPQAVPGFEGALAAPMWVCDSVPTNDNNEKVDGAEREVKGPGLGIAHENGTNHRFTDIAPGLYVPMHRTTSVDLNILIHGELVLILDDGSETHLKNPGDTVVQRGTLHAWRNPSSTDWTRWATVVIDAKPVIVDGKELPNEIQA
ncbi:hypothetical protein PENSPDRAFT_746805 [Peniophora sp. CONT]|nr:hypothetical protein PENSPDRAFT_746805 [Peniophora sp. CONT]